jgi:succinyl-diaminopimelate desuccinylase
MKDEILEIAKNLVEIESIASKPEKLKEVIDVVDNYFSNKNLSIKRYVQHSKHSIVVSNTKEKKKKIILNAHLDVVAAEKHLFKLKRDGDRITGRGVFDMKAFAAMLMVATDKITKIRPDLSLALIMNTDEEVGGENGMKYLLNKEDYSCDVAYIPDGGGHFNILTEEKGLLVLKITAYGTTAHSAYLWRGNNAIVKLINIYNKLIEAYPNPQADKDWKISINLSKIEGGDTLNKVPEKAVMYLDIRYPYPVLAKSIIKKAEEIINDDSVFIENIINGTTFYSNTENHYIQKYKGIAEAYLDRNVNFTKSPGAADARFLSEKGIPVIMTRCDGGGLHSPDEWISVPKLLQQYEMLMDFLKIVR